MLRWFLGVLGPFFSWWGAFVISALDSSVLFVVPFANDALLIYLVARKRDTFWIYPLIVTLGSIVGAAITYWIGYRAGQSGLQRLVAERHLSRLKHRIGAAGAGALAVAALMPPPFPLTPFVLMSGALDADRTRFFLVFGAVRLIRFGAEAAMARWYGSYVLEILQSDAVKTVIGSVAVLAVALTVTSGVVLWRRTRRP